MVRKKQFINKKTAQHFHVVHRSQRDPKANDPEASKYVLLSSKAQVEVQSDGEEDDDGDEFDEEEEEEEEDDSDDDMPDLVNSPRSDGGKAPASYEEALKSAKKKVVKPAKKVAFATRKVRFGGIVAEDLVDENGIVRDGYDYSQHMKEMGKGRFYSANGQFASQMDLARRVELPDDVLPSAEEQDRLLDAITLTTETMDSDLREALANDEAFEELDDDFMTQAAAEDPDADGDDGFDYDAHIAKLMAAASGHGAPKVKGDLTDSEDDDDEDDSEFDDEDDEDYEISAAEKSEQQRALDEAFERMMAEEYDEDQLGELDEEDPETRGDVVLEGELLASIVDDFVQVRQEMLNDEGKIGNPLRTGNRLKEILEECEKERLEDGETEDDDEPISPEDEAETERQLLEMYNRNAYFAPREEEQWDCETIVSTYSNLDNHPTVLREDGVLKKKKKKPLMATLNEDALAAAARSKSQIVLSRKTGMPLGVFETPAKKEKEPLAVSSNSTPGAVEKSKPKREESKEEKKARKEAAKLDKQQRRQEKKQWKTAFKEEEQRQLTLTKPGKVSVFKY